MWKMFITTDHKAGDPSQGDQADGMLKDSKERWVAIQYTQGEADSSIPLSVFFVSGSLHTNLLPPLLL